MGAESGLLGAFHFDGSCTAGDNENLLYLTDNEVTLQTINKWIGGGTKLSPTKTADVDILRDIVIKLQQREVDIRAEMGRMKKE